MGALGCAGKGGDVCTFEWWWRRQNNKASMLRVALGRGPNLVYRKSKNMLEPA